MKFFVKMSVADLTGALSAISAMDKTRTDLTTEHAETAEFLSNKVKSYY